MVIKMEIIKIDTASELMEALRITKNPVIILGEDCEIPGDAYKYSYMNGGKTIEIGMIVEEGYEKPELIVKNDIIVIGINDEVAIIQNDKLQSIIQKDSVFFEFIDISGCSSDFIAVFETVIIRFSLEGQIKWEYYPDDIITDVSLNGGEEKIVVSHFEGSNILLSLTTGEVL